MPLPPVEFKSDGCTAWFDGNWWPCCEAHDLSYWYGGTSTERMVADAKLARCVQERSNVVNAWLMHTFVRIFGACWLPAPFRWGYGWPWPQCGPER